MEISLYQIDAFSSKLFEGNPAAVCPLDGWLPDEIMQSIAAENNLSETAFFVPQGNDFHIRWYAPASEVDLCGHATLASAYVFFYILGFPKATVQFNSKSGALLPSTFLNGNDGRSTWHLPARIFHLYYRASR